jgi:CheY-like chemotaxis protein/HPt (histidine-containing phosphotransfer) domain-containing protein
MLGEFDVSASMASDGSEAVAAAVRFPYDLIFMDMRMPEMDGIAATRAIRARGGALAEVPIIALTANAFADDMKICTDAGMTDFIAKPVRKQMLVEAVLRALSRRAPGRREDTSAAAVTPDAEQAVFDRAVYGCFVDEIGEDGAQQTLAVFIRDTLARIARLRAASADDRDLIRHEAHTLKGAAGTFGFHQLSNLARGLETGAATIAEPDLRAAVGAIELAFARAQAEVAERLASAA